jgi:ribosomal protein L12E/L44/L45/RPP1/RPP2
VQTTAARSADAPAHARVSPQAEKINTLLKAAGVTVDSYYPGLFAKALAVKKLDELITNIGSGACAVPSRLHVGCSLGQALAHRAACRAARRARNTTVGARRRRAETLARAFPAWAAAFHCGRVGRACRTGGCSRVCERRTCGRAGQRCAVAPRRRARTLLRRRRDAQTLAGGGMRLPVPCTRRLARERGRRLDARHLAAAATRAGRAPRRVRAPQAARHPPALTMP